MLPGPSGRDTDNDGAYSQRDGRGSSHGGRRIRAAVVGESPSALIEALAFELEGGSDAFNRGGGGVSHGVKLKALLAQLAELVLHRHELLAVDLRETPGAPG